MTGRTVQDISSYQIKSSSSTVFLEGYKVIDLALHYNHMTEIIIKKILLHLHNIRNKTKNSSNYLQNKCNKAELHSFKIFIYHCVNSFILSYHCIITIFFNILQ